MRLLMIIKLLARELALADFILVFVRRDAMFGDGIAVSVFNGLGGFGTVGGFVTDLWLGGSERIWGGRSVVGIIVHCSSDDGGSCGEPRRR
jgi:hypothetical protein